MPRRTPVLAILLAPFVLMLLVSVWQKLLQPAWYQFESSDAVIQWRLDSANVKRRIAALQALGRKPAGTSLVPNVVETISSESAGPARAVAVGALGRIGSRQAIGESGMTALVDYLIRARDDQSLNTAVSALGHAAGNNRVPESGSLRIAGIFGEKHAPWLDATAAAALGRIGAAQPLPAAALSAMNRAFADPARRGQTDDLAQAFRIIAESRRLPAATLDLITARLGEVELGTTQTALLMALAYDADVYPGARATLERAAAMSRPGVADAARNGLRVLESRRLFATATPFEIALDSARPDDERIRALAVARANRIEPAHYADVVRLAASPESAVAAAALGLFRYIAAGPAEEFDRRSIIPALQAALEHDNPAIRIAAHGALSMIAARLPDYWSAASYGMFMLFFVLAHAGSSNAVVSLEISAVVWVANLAYGGLAYGLHFFVRN